VERSEAVQSLGTILLAAGSSSRLGQPKQLVTVEGQPLVLRQARLLSALKPVCTVVVTGALEAEIAQALKGEAVQLTHNSDWQQGMGRSLARGVEVMPERVRGVLVLLCDQWRIDQHDLGKLLETWAAHAQSAVVSQWDDTIGPPVIFPRSMFARLCRLQGEHGARQVLRRESAGVQKVVIEHAAWDLDVPSDLEQAGL
jgi:molybdenum cofactor cytidylyltransferase